MASENGNVWISLYFLANLGLTIHNKWVLQKLEFDFPWLLTAIHIGVSGVGAYVMVDKFKVCKSPMLSASENTSLVLFSLLYTINIAISNVSLNFVSLAFHQIVRSANPAFTVLLELLLLRKVEPLLVYVSLVPVVMFGVYLATIGEYAEVAFDMIGFCLTVFGVVLSALKGIATNIMMVGSLKLHPLDLLARMAPLAVAQCLIYAWYFGEFDGISLFIEKNAGENILSVLHPADSVYMKLLYNGIMAFFLNWVSFTANKKTSALTMTVAGNVKQAMSIVLAVYIFHTAVSPRNALGITITLIGGAWYR